MIQNPGTQNILLELEVDITTYTILVMHRTVDAHSIAFLLEFLIFVEDHMRRVMLVREEAELDSWYTTQFKKQGIHRFLNSHLSQFDSIVVWQDIIASFDHEFNCQDPALLNHLNNFAFSEEVPTFVKKQRIVITQYSKDLINCLFSEESALFKIGLNESLILASQYYFHRSQLSYLDFTPKELFQGYLWQQNEKRLK
jgi:hypothetical protein